MLDACDSEDEVVDQVAITVIHEVAHHFGIDDERLDQLGWRDEPAPGRGNPDLSAPDAMNGPCARTAATAGRAWITATAPSFVIPWHGRNAPSRTVSAPSCNPISSS
ncbi:metallopeptidase family protein [Escherichia coli]|uniref:metallopeptidase family protein n=1 Tax=Escherichia coli TaxID=562 RepID=UPI0032EA01A2